MFRRFDATIISNPVCDRSIDELFPEDFLYYDKDGFELCSAERKFYSAMEYPLDYQCLNHTCWQEPWFELDPNISSLILDHSLILHRANYAGAALTQLNSLKSTIPQADLLIRARQKWGFDFALDAISPEGKIYEVIHVEYDSTDYEQFKNRMISFEYTVRHTDWVDAALKIWNQRNCWENLRGFAQNHWKAKYLLGWKQAEYLEKVV